MLCFTAKCAAADEIPEAYNLEQQQLFDPLLVPSSGDEAQSPENGENVLNPSGQNIPNDKKLKLQLKVDVADKPFVLMDVKMDLTNVKTITIELYDKDGKVVAPKAVSTGTVFIITCLLSCRD